MDWCDHFKLVKADYDLSMCEIAFDCDVSKSVVYCWAVGRSVPNRYNFNKLKKLMPELQEPPRFSPDGHEESVYSGRNTTVNIDKTLSKRLMEAAVKREQSRASLLNHIVKSWLEANGESLK